jgi:ABC-2 type transport system ATP-binding protein
VRELIKDLSRSGKHTIVLSTHILSEVAEICRKVLVINQGKLVDIDTIDALRARHVDGKQASLEQIYLKLIDPTGALHKRSEPEATPPSAAALN